MSETEIVNGNKEECDLWIDRKSRFGNPFSIEDAPDSFPEDVKREYVIHLYRTWFRCKVKNDEAFAEAVENLRGKKLGCHCKPKPCHGDVIKKWLDGYHFQEGRWWPPKNQSVVSTDTQGDTG